MGRYRRDYEPRRDDSANRSFAIVHDRIEQSAAFKAAFDYAVRTTFSRFRQLPNPRTHGVENVAAMRAAGGASNVAKESIEKAIEHTPNATDNRGSQMWPMSVANVLRQNVAKVAEAAKELYRREVWPEQYR